MIRSILQEIDTHLDRPVPLESPPRQAAASYLNRLVFVGAVAISSLTVVLLVLASFSGYFVLAAILGTVLVAGVVGPFLSKPLREAVPQAAVWVVLSLTSAVVLSVYSLPTNSRIFVVEGSAVPAPDPISIAGAEPNGEELAVQAVERLQAGDIDGALADFNESLRQDDTVAGVWYGRGIVRLNLGEFASASEDFSAAIALDSAYATAYYARGVALNAIGAHTEAIGDLDSAISLSPDSAVAFYERGFAYQQLGMLERALEDLTRAIDLDGDLAVAYKARSELHAALGDDGAEAQDYSTYLEVESSDDDSVSGDPAMPLDEFNEISQAAESACSSAVGRHGESVLLFGKTYVVVEAGVDVGADVDSSGRILIAGSPGNDLIIGTEGDDVLRGGFGDDIICGAGGNDLLFGCCPGTDVPGDGDDVLIGGSGQDTLQGGSGSDLLAGDMEDYGPGAPVVPFWGHEAEDSEPDYCEPFVADRSHGCTAVTR